MKPKAPEQIYLHIETETLVPKEWALENPDHCTVYELQSLLDGALPKPENHNSKTATSMAS